MNSEPSTAAPASPARRMLMMGVGGSGTRAVAAMARTLPGLEAVAVDTDAQALAAAAPGRTVQVGAAVTRGLSAGGDMELGRQSIEKDSSTIRGMLRGVDLLVVAAGLGGGTASGAVPVVARLAHEAGALVLCLVSLPFAFEGKMAAKAAEESLKRIRTHADAVVRLPNERLIDRAEEGLATEEAFGRSHRVMNDAISALWRMLSQNGVCGLDFAHIHTMLRNCDGFCHFASAGEAGPGRAEAVAKGLLRHRLLNNGKLLAGSPGVVVGLTGGADLLLGEIETVMNCVQAALNGEAWLRYGVCIDAGHAGRLSAFALLAEQWREPLVDGANRQLGLPFVRAGAPGQGELPLEPGGKGSFAKLDPTILNNQDIDVPTYLRRDIKLPR